MNSIRWLSGSVSKTWNSINPATLSGAIDVIVVEHEDGSLACSPFHVRFGKFSLLRPYEKKVEFKVNGEKQDYAMKLGEGGEAFFVFETSDQVPAALQTSPLVSPVASPTAGPLTPSSEAAIPDVEPLSLDENASKSQPDLPKAASTLEDPFSIPGRARADTASAALPTTSTSAPSAGFDTGNNKQNQDGDEHSASHRPSGPAPTPHRVYSTPDDIARHAAQPRPELDGTTSAEANPPSSPKQDAVSRAMTLSKRLWSSNIPTKVNDEGDLMLDMTGYKSSEEEALRAEVVARQILSEELEGNYDIGSLIGADEKGNLWIYNSEEAKDAAARKAGLSMMHPTALVSSDALSDPGYHSDDNRSETSIPSPKPKPNERRQSDPDSGLGLSTPDSPSSQAVDEPSRNYAKTLRLTSDQLHSLNLKYGPNPMSFSVNRATCTAYMYLWKSTTPIVISDIDGTITKSDALGHVLNMIGRDWTHVGVAKLYSDIAANGYNIFYLTSRSVGQADTTRAYINGIVQDGGYRLPKGPVIMSPDRTIAALRREIYLRKPEVFKMACLRDIMSLFRLRQSPFYAGFGNRLTDALSYRSVNIPSTRIFTINSNAEVSLDLLSLNKYKTAYTSMRETVDHFFPPVGMLVQEGGEAFTDFNYWRDEPRELQWISDDEGSITESEDGRTAEGSEDEEEEDEEDRLSESEVLSEDLADSYLSTGRGSLEESLSNLVRQSLEASEGGVNWGESRLDEVGEVRDEGELEENTTEVLVPVKSGEDAGVKGTLDISQLDDAQLEALGLDREEVQH